LHAFIQLFHTQALNTYCSAWAHYNWNVIQVHTHTHTHPGLHETFYNSEWT